MPKLSLLAAVFVLCLSACGHTRSSYVDKIRVRHAAEFGCRANDVTVDTLEWSFNYQRGTFNANGCGQKAIYVCVNGTCVRDSDARAGSSPAKDM